MEKKIKLYVMEHGTIGNDLTFDYGVHYDMATIDDKEKNRWVKFPQKSVLIDHPTEGYILYDTGNRKDLDQVRSEKHKKIFYWYHGEEDFLENRLSELGLSPKDIDTIIISHLHFDHVGNLYLFESTNPKVYVHEEELKHALYVTHKTSEKGIIDGYRKEDFCLEGIDFTTINKDMDLTDDIRILTFTGHTPGILGLLVNLENTGPLIFTSDAFFAKENYEECLVPGGIYDSLGFLETREKLKRLERKYDARIIFGHDPKQIKELKTSPNYYD